MKDLNTRMFIVIGEEHYTTLGVVRTLGEAGIRPVVVLVGKGSPIVSKSKYPLRLWKVDTYGQAVELVLKRYGGQFKKPCIIANGDMTVQELDARYDDLKNDFIFNNAGQSGRIGYYQDKENLNCLGSKYGLNVPKSWRVNKGEIPKDITYPVITKPLQSYVGWKKDYYICKNDGELREAYDKIKGVELLLQQYVKKETERTYEGASCAMGKDVFFAIQTRYTYMLPDSYSMEMDIFDPDNPSIEKALRGMLSEIGFEGIFEVEFMEDTEGQLWFLEINFRNSTWSYACTKLGMPLPLLWADGEINGKFSSDIRKNIPVGYRALAEVPDFEQRVRRFKMLTVGEWIKAVRSADCLFFYSKEDPAPCRFVWYAKVKRLLAKKFNKKL